MPALSGRTVAILCDFTFEDMELMWPKMRLEEEGATVVVVGGHPAGTKYTGKYGYPVKSDKCADDVSADDFAALIIPGGFAPDYMRRVAKLCTLTTTMLEQGKPVAAICHGPWMFCSARRAADNSPVIKGHSSTAFVAIKDDIINAGATWVDQPVCISRSFGELLITSRTPGDLIPFALAIIDAIKSSSSAGSAMALS